MFVRFQIRYGLGHCANAHGQLSVLLNQWGHNLAGLRRIAGQQRINRQHQRLGVEYSSACSKHPTAVQGVRPHGDASQAGQGVRLVLQALGTEVPLLPVLRGRFIGWDVNGAYAGYRLEHPLRALDSAATTRKIPGVPIVPAAFRAPPIGICEGPGARHNSFVPGRL
ncbi:hypothetical protein D3C76_173570 [compost metagenome]